MTVEERRLMEENVKIGRESTTEDEVDEVGVTGETLTVEEDDGEKRRRRRMK